MANNFRLAVANRNSMCDNLVDDIDAGAGAGTLKIYTASQPTNPDTAIGAQVLLATLTFGDPAFGASASGTATANSITADSSADASGTAAWFRIQDSDSNAVADGEIGTSGADINFNNVSFTAGDEVQITSLTITVPLQD